MKALLARVVCLFCVFCFSDGAISNSVSISESPQDFVNFSKQIVIGTVVNIKETNATGGFCLSKLVEVKAAETIKGEKHKGVVFLTNDSSIVAGSTYLLFLRQWSGPGYFDTCKNIGSPERIVFDRPYFLPEMIASKYLLVGDISGISNAFFRVERCIGYYEVLLEGLNLEPTIHHDFAGRALGSECKYFSVGYGEMKRRIWDLERPTYQPP